MAETSSIEWTDATWNVLTGCSVISPGCTNCYAMRLAGSRLRNHVSRKGLTRTTKAGPVWTGEVRFNNGENGLPDWLRQPLRWRRARNIFVCAHSDLFHESVTDDQLDQIFAVMALCSHHTFQVLTKRPERMHQYLTSKDWARHVMKNVRLLAPSSNWNGNIFTAGTRLERSTPFLPNVWLGTSTEDQKRADERMPWLMSDDLRPWYRFVSAEPLIGPLDLSKWLDRGLEWVISGGESGPGARPTDPEWHRKIRDDCKFFGALFHFKQWGSWDADALRYTDMRGQNPPPNMKVGKKKAGRLLDGREHNDIPNFQQEAA